MSLENKKGSVDKIMKLPDEIFAKLCKEMKVPKTRIVGRKEEKIRIFDSHSYQNMAIQDAESALKMAAEAVERFKSSAQGVISCRVTCGTLTLSSSGVREDLPKEKRAHILYKKIKTKKRAIKKKLEKVSP